VRLLDELPRTRNELHLIEHRLEKIVVVFNHLRDRESRTRIVFKQPGCTDFVHCASQGGNLFLGQITTQVERCLSIGFFVQWFGIDNHTVQIKKNGLQIVHEHCRCTRFLYLAFVLWGKRGLRRQGLTLRIRFTTYRHSLLAFKEIAPRPSQSVDHGNALHRCYHLPGSLGRRPTSFHGAFSSVPRCALNFIRGRKFRLIPTKTAQFPSDRPPCNWPAPIAD